MRRGYFHTPFKREILLIPLLSPLAVAQSSTASNSNSPPPASVTSTASRDSATPAILRPSDGETLYGGRKYTIQWTPPTEPGYLAIELWDRGTAPNEYADAGDRCDGWLVNTECFKIADEIPSGNSYVWDVPMPDVDYSPPEEGNSRYSGNVSIRAYVSEGLRWNESPASSSWYVRGGEFVIYQDEAHSPNSSTSSSRVQDDDEAASNTDAGSEPTETDSAAKLIYVPAVNIWMLSVFVQLALFW